MWRNLAFVFLLTFQPVASSAGSFSSLGEENWSFTAKGEIVEQNIKVGKDLFYQISNVSSCCSGVYSAQLNLISISKKKYSDLVREYSVYIPIENYSFIRVNGLDAGGVINGRSYALIPLAGYSENDLEHFKLSVGIENKFSVFSGIWRESPKIGKTNELIDLSKNDILINSNIPLMFSLILLLSSLLFFGIAKFLSKNNIEFYYFSKSLLLWGLFNFFLSGLPRVISFDIASSLHMSARILASLGLYYLLFVQSPSVSFERIKKWEISFFFLAAIAYIGSRFGSVDAPVAMYALSLVISFSPAIHLFKEKLSFPSKTIIVLAFLAITTQVSDVLKLLAAYHSFNYNLPYLSRYFNTPLILTSFIFYVWKFSNYHYQNRVHLFNTNSYARAILHAAKDGLSHNNINYFLKVASKICAFRRVSLSERQSDGSYKTIQLYGSKFVAEGATIDFVRIPDIAKAISTGSIVFGNVDGVAAGWKTSHFTAVPVPFQKDPQYLMLLSDPKKDDRNSKDVLPYLSQLSSAIWTNLERTREQNLRMQTEQKFSSLVQQLDPNLYDFIVDNLNKMDDPNKLISSVRGIVFFDQKSYSTMTENFDDETMGRFARIVGEWVTKSAARYGARISNFAGDAFLLEAFSIGAESEHSIAQRTLNLAWHLGQTMGELNQILLKEDFYPITFRFGAHIGNVAAANLDFIQKGLSNSIGDTVNVTARLQSIAKAGSIYISGELAQHITGEFVIAPVPKKYVKGRSKKIDIFSLVGKTDSDNTAPEKVA